ncbi:heterogeneous nuclear ribonucleoprotein K isoform X3 [Dermacentor silvarum]|uniref:heterogeneous nuclear ribonucleoprotein K isoform X3 n=1 Tax=Dermacentor silvarum TaxID=543639 RepID=UPI00210068F5|nr:heterogeneous nuclear ribonucleoprotein K isoform X3 [Dermacentor silvarum]
MSEGAVAVEPSDGLQKRQRSDHEPWTTQMEAGVPSGNQLTMGGLTVRLRASDRGTLVEAVLLTVRFLLQSRNAGAIIGKGGSNINSLRKEFKASISVPDCPGPERILSIVADLDTLGEILLNIIPKLDDFAQHTGQNGGSESEMRLLMHQSHAGCIIGRAGCRIKELRESTGANIKVHGSCCPGSTERIVKVTGSPPVVVDCIKQICDIIGVAPIKGLNKPYDPHNFDPEFAQEYGGFGEGAAGGVSGGGGSLAGMSVGPTRGDLPRSYRGGGMPRGGTYGRGNYNGR